MSGFFARLGDRAAGREAPLQPRRPPAFDAAPIAAEPELEEVESFASGARLEEQDPIDAPTRRAAAPVEHATPADPTTPAVAEPAFAPRAALRPASAPGPPPTGDSPPAPPAPALPPPSSDEGSPQVAEPLRAAPPPTDAASIAAEPDERLPPAAEEEQPRPQFAERTPKARPRARRRVPRPAPGPSTPPLDLAALLREHVLPALVDRGVVSRDEGPVVAQPAVAPAGPHDPPRPGTVVVRASPPAAYAAIAPGEPDVRDGDHPIHLHIDRVVVTRAPAPAPPAPAVPARPPRRTVDHAAYLARRERP